MGDRRAQREKRSRWTHGAVSFAIVLALVAAIATVLTFDYLADRADDVVVGAPEDVDIPFTPQPSTETPSTTASEPAESSSPAPTAEATPSTPAGSAPPVQAVQPPITLQPVPQKTCVPDASTSEISVIAYNIKTARWDGRLQLDAIADALATWDADIVLLQEVDKNRSVTGGVDQAAYLGERLGMYSTFGSNVAYTPTALYGTAILSRFPIVSSENTPLPKAAPSEQQRGLLHAVIDVDGTQVSAYSTHLQNRSPGARVRQVDAIRGLLAADELPKVMGGDFNAHPGSPEMRTAVTFIDDTWASVGVGSGFTHPSTNPRGRIDYLLHDGLEPLGAQVLDGPVSDHKPVQATYSVSSSSLVCVPVFD
jgi:endonuclease/exonuclease/phosphatase family metal-dependent hydrolase